MSWKVSGRISWIRNSCTVPRHKWNRWYIWYTFRLKKCHLSTKKRLFTTSKSLKNSILKFIFALKRLKNDGFNQKNTVKLLLFTFLSFKLYRYGTHIYPLSSETIARNNSINCNIYYIRQFNGIIFINWIYESYHINFICVGNIISL